MAEYGSMFLVSGLATILFFGGWHGPIPLFGPEVLGWSYETAASDWTLTGYLANLAGCVNFVLKATVGVTFMIWVRWTFPRLRIDQVITTCLKYCVPIAAACFLGALVWEAADIPSLNDLHLMSNRSKATIRENWVLPTKKTSANEETTKRDQAAESIAALATRRQHTRADSAAVSARQVNNQPGGSP